MAKSLLDSDFEDEDQFSDFSDDNDDGDADEPLVKPSKAKPRVADEDGDGRKADSDLEIEVIDDTPEADRNKPVAKDDDDFDNSVEDEAKSYSKEVQKRIAKATAKAHAERRRADEKERQLQAAEQYVRRLLDESNSLKGVIETGEKALYGEHKSRLEGQLAAARSSYREANEAGDVNGMMAAQENIARAISQMERLSGYQSRPLPREDPASVDTLFRGQRQAQQGQSQADPKAVAWAKKNDWFWKDDVMRAHTLALHERLVNNGVTPDDDRYYKEIDKEVRKRFPERFGAETQPRRTGTVVAPATRTDGRASPRKVTLTESEVRLARRLGLTNQQYASQKLIEQELGDGKEFTHAPRT